MQSLRALRPACRNALSRRQIRSASDHAAPGKDESFGRGFYISLASVPVLLTLYKLTAPDENASRQPYLTRLIGSLDRWRLDLAQREDLHTRTIEQAGRDRNLFLNSEDVRAVPMRYPEQFDQVSPWNVPAGQGRGNYEKALAKFQREVNEHNDSKLQALRDGTLRAEQPHGMPHRHFPTGV